MPARRSLEDLALLPIAQVQEELADTKRPQLMQLAKQCGAKANQRNAELIASIAEYIGSMRGGQPMSAQKTPYNPVYNPCYALTDTAKAVRAQLEEAGENVAPSTGPEQRKVWHVTKSKELAELEAALKSLPPRSAGRRRTSVASGAGTPAGAATLAPATRLTGSKRKASDASVATPVTDQPSAKRSTPGSAAANNTLMLKNEIIRRPGRSKTRGPSRLGLSSSTAAVPAPAAGPAPAPPAAAPAKTPAAAPVATRRPSAAPSSTKLRASAAARASKAHEAYVARMQRAKQGSATPASARR